MDNMMAPMGSTKPVYKVRNDQNYDIGVVCENGNQKNIRAHSFALLTMDDIQYIESIAPLTKFFGSGKLTVEDGNGNPVRLDYLMIEEAPKEERVLTEEEITACLKKSAKQMESWLNGIEDPVQLHAIYTVATGMDLPASKLKILNAKMPSKDWLDEMS